MYNVTVIVPGKIENLPMNIQGKPRILPPSPIIGIIINIVANIYITNE